MSQIEEEIAAEIRAAYGAGVIPPFANRLEASDVSAAYRIQEINTRFWQAEGRQIVGRKIGLTALAVQAQFGVDQPDYGILFADRRLSDGGILSSGALQPRIEAEVAFVMARDFVDPLAGLDAFRSAVGEARPALEIVDSRVENWRISIIETIADNASAGWFVLGEEARDPDEVDFVDCAMRLTDGDSLVSEGRGSACMGSPLEAGLWLAKTMCELGRPLAAGDIVMSGALGPMKDMRRGARYEAIIEDLGSVSISF
ncbi:MAG: 2-keto-4-pentenoate hydratase [Caulobacteraceae bacterium]